MLRFMTRFHVRVQILVAFVLPVLLAVALGIAAFSGFNAMRTAQMRLAATTTYRAAARDLMLQILSQRYATRTMTLTGKADPSQPKAEAAQRKDLAVLITHASDVPGAGAKLAPVQTLVEAMQRR